MLLRFLPESVRWLSVNGKYEEAEVIVKHMAKMNKSDYPKHLMENNVSFN